MLDQVLEGTWEEITAHADELAGKRVRLIVLEEAPAMASNAPRPNEAMLEALRKIAARNEGKPLTLGEDTQRLLREARAGAMFDYKVNLLMS